MPVALESTHISPTSSVLQRYGAPSIFTTHTLAKRKRTLRSTNTLTEVDRPQEPTCRHWLQSWKRTTTGAARPHKELSERHRAHSICSVSVCDTTQGELTQWFRVSSPVTGTTTRVCSKAGSCSRAQQAPVRPLPQPNSPPALFHFHYASTLPDAPACFLSLGTGGLACVVTAAPQPHHGAGIQKQPPTKEQSTHQDMQSSIKQNSQYELNSLQSSGLCPAFAPSGVCFS